MPTYEYQCKGCGHEFERVQRITDDRVKTCPKCKKRKVERLISQTSFVLKGGGWYNDLYASKKADASKDPSKDPSKDSDKDSKKDGTAAEPAADTADSKKKKDGKKDSKPSKDGKKPKGPKAAA